MTQVTELMWFFAQTDAAFTKLKAARSKN